MVREVTKDGPYTLSFRTVCVGVPLYYGTKSPRLQGHYTSTKLNTY